MNDEKELAIWGGLEATINRVGDQYFDQSEYSGHYQRGLADADLVASLGITMLRYPVLWERHQPEADSAIDWRFAGMMLSGLRDRGVTPIAGLVHHGSGPRWVNFFDGSFEEGLAAYARRVAEQFPWLEYYTPVNEPLTTARFCGLYGHWYPHGTDDYSFFKILMAECKATVMAMEEIRKINPEAKLVQTEDLGRCYSTPLLAYQAELENHRRWLSYDLLCGRVNEEHFMWPYLLKAGILPQEILYFTEHYCVPWVAGFNYYITSERFLDEDLTHYPEQYHGGNEYHRYADIETVLVRMTEPSGPERLLREAWEHLQLPIAITECHLHSTREDQVRWFHRMWTHCNNLRADGVPIQAITAWALFGLHGWNCLVTKPCGDYEPGVFNLSSGSPRPTALAWLLRELTHRNEYYHPILEHEGWWMRENRRRYGRTKVVRMRRPKQTPGCRPLLILGKTGTLGRALSRICNERNIHHQLIGRQDIDLTREASIREVLERVRPWAVINAAGYVQVDKAEKDCRPCFDANCYGPAALAAEAQRVDAQFLSFSSDLVFDGKKGTAYTEADEPRPLNVYGQSKAESERLILHRHPEALVLRTSSFFGPWDPYNFAHHTLQDLREGRTVRAASDVIVSPTYVPDLAHLCIDLLMDRESGVLHATNEGELSWADWARMLAVLTGSDGSLVQAVPAAAMRWPAQRPAFSALRSERGIRLPSLEDAMERYLQAIGIEYTSRRVAV